MLNLIVIIKYTIGFNTIYRNIHRHLPEENIVDLRQKINEQVIVALISHSHQ